MKNSSDPVVGFSKLIAGFRAKGDGLGTLARPKLLFCVADAKKYLNPSSILCQP